MTASLYQRGSLILLTETASKPSTRASYGNLNRPHHRDISRALHLARFALDTPRPRPRDSAMEHVSSVDSAFYQPAEPFFPAQHGNALTSADVTLATLYSEVLPRDANLETQLADGITLSLPMISADMD